MVYTVWVRWLRGLEMSYRGLWTMDELRIALISNSILAPGPLNTECWIWTGTTPSTGYGCMSWRFNDFTETEQAHRLSWLAFRGKIPDGMWVLHDCDVKACINPRHLHVDMPQINTYETEERHPTWRHTRLVGPKRPMPIPANQFPAWRRI